MKSYLLGCCLFGFVITCWILLVPLSRKAIRDGHTAERCQAEMAKLQGTWFEERALAGIKPQGMGFYYVWVFDGDKVARHHVTTNYGDPVMSSGIGGTYKVDPAANPNAIDISLEARFSEEEITWYGIYELEGDTLKLSHAFEYRPAVFEHREDNRMYVLKRRRE
jgi:uncharacterized protein (TIGR03067 family)